MANGLTGNYDAVVEVMTGTINRLLASIHQKGSGSNVSPKFPHSLTARIGDPPKSPAFQLAESFLDEYFGAGNIDVTALPQHALAAVQENVIAVQKSVDQLVESLSGVQVVGSPSLNEDAGSPVARWRGLPRARGTAKIQIGTPRVSVEHGATLEVEARAQIRASYLPDPNSPALPTPIHGEVRATFDVKINAAQATPKITVTPSEGIDKVKFIPAPGTPASGSMSKALQILTLTGEVRRFLKTKFDAIETDLPQSFPFRQFKGLEAGNRRAVAFPLMLSGQHIPALALSGINELFAKADDDFAIAISPFYVGTVLQPALKPIEDFHAGQKIIALWVTLTAYSADVTKATINFEAGALVLSVFGKVKVWGALVSDADYNFTVVQKFNLKLDSASQAISLQTSGGLSIAGLPQKIEDLARPKIEAARDNAVATAQPMIQDTFKDRRAALNEALKRFDKAANAKFTAVEIDPEGIILRGDVSLSTRAPAVVDVADLAGGAALTAFKSWIPAGGIARFNWSWLESTGDIARFPWEAVETKKSTDPHRFTLAVGGPGKPQPGQRICLEIEGSQDGSSGEITAGEVCHVEAPWWTGVAAGVSSALAKILLVPVWGPDPGPEGILDQAIVAHMNLHADQDVTAPGIPAIVHFRRGGMPDPLRILNEAMLRSRHAGKPIPVIVVLEPGSFSKARNLVERQLGAIDRRFPGPLIITEDYEQGWARAFGVTQRSVTALVHPSGEEVWRSEDLERDSLTSALDARQIGSNPVGVRPSAFALRGGDAAPEAFYAEQDDAVRGQRTTIMFWKSWSAPCVRELIQWQEEFQRSGSGDGVLMAIGDGEKPEAVVELGRKLGLTYRLMADPDRRLSNLFRINCWPTTISISEDGIVERAHAGISRHLRLHPRRSA